jgi:hypothetical protein
MAIPTLAVDDLEEMRRLCGQIRKVTGSELRREYLDLNPVLFIVFLRTGK